MGLRYFSPAQNFTPQEMEKITCKVPGKWSAPPATLLWLANNGFEIIEITGFDNKRFVNEGAAYLRGDFGETFARAQEAQGDLGREQAILKQVLDRIQLETRIPTRADITRLLEENYVTLCHVNSSQLNPAPGYVGHYVVITGTNDVEIIVHDPGLPPQPNRSVPWRLFQKAWAYPNEKAKNLIGFRRQR